MKFLVLALCVCSATAAVVSTTSKPSPPPVVVHSEKDSEAQVLRSVSVVNKDGFNYEYETGNGIIAEASGTLKNVEGVDVVVMKGQFTYPGADGVPILFTYTADEDGFHPESDYLPTPPPTPEYVLRMIEYFKEHPEKLEKTRK